MNYVVVLFCYLKVTEVAYHKNDKMTMVVSTKIMRYGQR